MELLQFSQKNSLENTFFGTNFKHPHAFVITICLALCVTLVSSFVF